MKKLAKGLMPIIFIGIFLGLIIFNNFNLASSSNTGTSTTAEKSVFMYLSLKGETQGDIIGSVTENGHEDSIEVLSYSHSIISPRDAASGLPTGKRQHSPLVITKQIDRSTPLLYQALIMNEELTTWKLEFWKISQTGKSEMFYSIELYKASIAEISPRGSNFGSTEHVAFCYQKIIWTWVDGGVTAEDDWETPNA